MFYYYLYEIRNNLTGHIYVGVHKTKNMNDGYMGSGKLIKRVLAKYGVENFTKTILETFSNSHDMYTREKEIVTQEFLARDDVYNLSRGGHGGWDYIHENGLTNKNKSLDSFYKEFSKKGNQKHIEMLNNDENYRNKWLTKVLHTQTDETKDKISKSLSGRKRNKMWITDGNKNLFVDTESEIPAGFRKGRVVIP